MALRCIVCRAPYAGIGGRVMGAVGFAPSRKNPHLCSRCFEKAPMGGQEIEVGILLADIRGFTTLAEREAPDRVAGLLNRFYAGTERALVRSLDGRSEPVDRPPVGEEARAMDPDDRGRSLKFRLLICACAALVGLAFAPAGANACASVAGVQAFTGHAYVSFTGSASGPITGSGGSESIGIDRKGATLELDLNHKVRGKGKFSGTYIFSGKVWAGTISVDDAFSLSEGSSAEDTYSGNGAPAFGGVSAFLDTANCHYVVAVNFGVDTQFSGAGVLSAGTGASLAAVGDHDKIPGSLHLVGGVGPDGYLTCPGDPILDGNPCVEIGGGWATDFAELKECGSFPPEGNCATGEKPIGDGKFLWVLKPSK